MSAGLELAREVRTLVRRRASGGEVDPSFDRALWARLAAMDVFALMTPDLGGTARDLCGCLLELGAGGVAGPIVETVVAGQLDLGPDRERIAAGELVATVAWAEDLVPWIDVADVVVFVRDARAYRASVEVEARVGTLAGEQWGRGKVTAGDPVDGLTPALAVGELAIAAYLVGAGLRIVEMCAEYAASRRQFGRALGDFQAVSHPLAEAYAWLNGLRDVLASDEMEAFDPIRPESAARSARLRVAATSAATRASYTGFQTQGGMGFVDGTELALLGKRLRQVSLSGVPQDESVRRATETVV